MEKRILVVEDDSNQRLLQKEVLEKEGYEVILANSGQEALERIDKEAVDLVLLDVRMPGMDGIETLGRILGKRPDLRVIIYTAYPHYQENFMSWAAEAYVVKSSDFVELKTKIKEALEKKKR